MDHLLEQSYRDCLELARTSRSNFYYTFFTLPRDLFRDTCVLYAFMRHTDDLGDAPDGTIDSRRALLLDWREQLQLGFQGKFRTDSHRQLLPAMMDVIRRREIPLEYLSEVISGVERDLEPEVFQTFEDLNSYCYQVAGVVGECCVRIWGCSGAECSARALACGNAFQLTNILRDLGEDTDRGRCYLPREDLARFQCSLEDIQTRRMTPGFKDMMAFQVRRAREYYQQAELLRENLSPAGQRILGAMLEIYGGLLQEIDRRDFDVFSTRVTLPAWRKWLVVGKSLWPWRRTSPV